MSYDDWKTAEPAQDVDDAIHSHTCVICGRREICKDPECREFDFECTPCMREGERQI